MSDIIDNRIEPLPRKITPPEATVIPPTRVGPRAIRVSAILFMAFIIGAEVVTVMIGLLPGAILYGILLVGLLNYYYFSHTVEERRIYLALTLVPVLRFLSLAMPNPLVSQVFWYVMIGLPLLVSVIRVAGVNGLSSLRIDLTGVKWAGQFMIGLSGIPLGVIAALSLKAPLDVSANLDLLWFIFLIIVITLFGAVIEEIIFRGLIQRALSYPFGWLSVVFSSILYASMFLGTLSPNAILLYGLSGLLFSVWVKLSNSLWGVIMAHSLMNIIFLSLARFFLA
jgi:membrane protease YdiL (CAAX protease family)